MHKDRRQLSALVLVALAGGCASILMFWITAFGPGVSTDSVTYIETARSLLAGDGFYDGGQPMTHYPPVYPLLLAIAGLLQRGDVLQAGRLLAALLFGANLALFGLAVLICTDRSLSATACAICVFIASAPIIYIHSNAWSEAPFITFALAALVLLSQHVVRPKTYLLLLAASLSAGCAIAARYMGVTLLPPMVFALFVFGDRPIKKKIGDTVLLTTVALLPLAAWLVRNIITAETATNRTFAVHVFDFGHTKQLIDVLYEFVLPISISRWTEALHLGAAVALFLVSIALLHKKNYITRNTNTVRIVLPTLCMFFFLTYIAFLVVSISFFDAATPVDSRILLPAFLAILVVSISLAWSLSSALDSWTVSYGFILFVFFSVTVNLVPAIEMAVDIHRNGRGLTSRKWKHSDTIASVTSLAKDVKIYSNGVDAVQFLTGRRANLIPPVTSPITLKANHDYEAQLQVMCSQVGDGEAIIVYFDGITIWYLPSLQDLEAKCVMPVIGRLDDGAIYGRTRKQAEQGAALDRDLLSPTIPLGR